MNWREYQLDLGDLGEFTAFVGFIGLEYPTITRIEISLGSGALDVRSFISEEKIQEIRQHFIDNPESPKAIVGDRDVS